MQMRGGELPPHLPGARARPRWLAWPGWFVLALLVLLAGRWMINYHVGYQLYSAASTGDLATVRAMLDGGVDPDRPTVHGLEAIAIAAHRGHIEVVREFLSRGADPQHGVMSAIGRGHADVLRLLLAHGATIRDPEAALLMAKASGGPEVVRITEEWLKDHPTARDRPPPKR